MTAHIKLRNLSVDFPVFNAKSRSLKNRLVSVATGGKLGEDRSGFMSVRALEDISLTIGVGDRVAILGHNGSGKSTLLRVIAGVYRPSHGDMSISGSVGSLIDISLGIDAEATGIENIYIRCSLLGMPKAQITRLIEDIIDFSELGQFIEMPLRTYSSGMQFRLAFSIATIIRPDILLMDEWLSTGDSHFRDKAENRLMEIVSESKIMLIATHSQELAQRICNKFIRLEHGKVVEISY
jgi:lipopolysaccharide transport system ATP-binding protein